MPVTEYTSDTPSISAMAEATSGIRAVSAWTKTIAVIMRSTLAQRK